MTKAEITEVAQETCMEHLKEKDCALKLTTGRVKELHDFLAEQFILTYIRGKNLFSILDDLESGKFYNTWRCLWLASLKNIGISPKR